MRISGLTFVFLWGLAIASTKTPPPQEHSAFSQEQTVELLQEIFQVTLGRPLEMKARDREKFPELLGAVLQGASLEGAYNNLVSSTEFRKQMQDARGFKSALCKIDQELRESLGLNTNRSQLSECIQKRRPFFQLKEEIAAEAIDLLDRKKADPQSRARWYGDWAAQLSKRGVDFGIKGRNSSDTEFHRQWAIDASEDLLKWEVLNRLHRSMNHEFFH